jgi:hypothetical protein
MNLHPLDSPKLAENVTMDRPTCRRKDLLCQPEMLGSLDRTTYLRPLKEHCHESGPGNDSGFSTTLFRAKTFVNFDVSEDSD